jgi:hypothetical protein
MRPAADIERDWQMRIPDSEWAVYSRVIREVRSAGIRFAFGGAYATAVYTDQLRNTKDLDFYILPADGERIERALTRAGLHDHFDQLSYDRKWIYRASQGDILVDAIWQMANYRAQVDEQWLVRGPEVVIRGEALRAIPIEELIWSKLYVFQRERCDWTDVFRLIDARSASINWEHLLDRLADDAPLLAGALEVYSWLAPDRAGQIEQGVWGRLGLPYPALIPNPELSRARADLLDSRPWFRTPE